MQALVRDLPLKRRERKKEKKKQQLQEKQKIATTQVHSLYPMLFTWHSRDILPSIPIAASVCWHGSVTLLLS